MWLGRSLIRTKQHHVGRAFEPVGGLLQAGERQAIGRPFDQLLLLRRHRRPKTVPCGDPFCSQFLQVITLVSSAVSASAIWQSLLK